MAEVWTIAKRQPPELFAFVLSFMLFAVMAAPGIEWMDPGELTAAAYTLGGAHAPGHPAHTLFGKLATLLPFGEIAFRVNLLSAFTMAVAVAGVVALSRSLLATELVAACVAAGLVTLSPVTQLNATRAEVYAPVTALVIWAMVATVRFVRGGEQADGRYVLGAGLGCGLAAAFHPVIALAAAIPMMIALAWHGRHRLAKLAPPTIGLGVLGLVCYAYLPLRANAATTPVLMWGDPSSPTELWTLISGGAYQGNFALSGATSRFAELMLVIGEGMGLTILFAGMLGLAFASISGLKSAGIIAASCFLVIAGAATQSRYNPDMPGYVLPALMMLAVGLAPITGAVVRMLPRPPPQQPPSEDDFVGTWRHAIAAGVLLPLVAIGITSGVLRAEDGGFRSHDDPLRWFSQTVDKMPPGPGLYFAEGDPSLFAAQYERFVAGARPDIAIANTALLQDRWFVRQVFRQQPDIVDDGLLHKRGAIGVRLAVQNVTSRVVGGDAPVLGPLFGVPMGRGYLYQRTLPAASASTKAPAPANFGGYVGRRVSGSMAIARATLELNLGRFDQAVVAAGLQTRFADVAESLRQVKTDPRRGGLLGAVRRSSPARHNLFLYEPWQTELLGDEIAWRAGLPDVALPPNAGFERKLHQQLRRLLRRDATLADTPLTRRDHRGAEQTVMLLLRTGMAHCVRGEVNDARSLWLEAVKLEPGQRPAAKVLGQLQRCKAPGKQTPTP